MAKAKDSTDEAKAKAHPDYKLIKACVEYAFTMGAAQYAYKIDPTDADFAAKPDMKRLQRGRALLAEIASVNAATFDGLAAKAATIVMMDDANVLDMIGDDEVPAIVSLAADVVRFHKLAGGKHSSSPTHQTFGGVQ